MAFLKKQLSHPYHFIFIIAFFLLNGWRQNLELIPVSDLAVLAIYLLILGGVMYLLFRRIFNSRRKAGLFTSLVLLICLFFGVVKDFLSGIPSLAGLSRMGFLLIAILVIYVGIFYLISRRNDPPKGIHFFLNLLFLIYIVIDIALILIPGKPSTYTRGNSSGIISEIIRCDTCKNPDIYLVVADEYMGTRGLREFFNYDDSEIVQFLQQKGFHVIPNPYSNYYFTVFSMASLLNMDYPPGLGPQNSDNPYGYQRSIEGIRNNLFCHFLQQRGYQVRNYSIFDLGSVISPYHNSLVPLRTELLTDKTIYNRVMKALPHILVNTLKWEWYAKKLTQTHIQNNESMLAESIQAPVPGNHTPTFTYVHLSMPHEPYAYDRLGQRTNLTLERSKEEDKSAYLDYLVYTNGRLKTYISQLMESTHGNAIVLLLSDHGYRGSGQPGSKNPLSVLNAIYLPGKDYKGWYDSISHVNHLRILLNTQFGQKLPLLKDSVVH